MSDLSRVLSYTPEQARVLFAAVLTDLNAEPVRPRGVSTEIRYSCGLAEFAVSTVHFFVDIGGQRSEYNKKQAEEIIGTWIRHTAPDEFARALKEEKAAEEAASGRARKWWARCRQRPVGVICMEIRRAMKNDHRVDTFDALRITNLTPELKNVLVLRINDFLREEPRSNVNPVPEYEL